MAVIKLLFMQGSFTAWNQVAKTIILTAEVRRMNNAAFHSRTFKP